MRVGAEQLPHVAGPLLCAGWLADAVVEGARVCFVFRVEEVTRAQDPRGVVIDDVAVNQEGEELQRPSSQIRSPFVSQSRKTDRLAGRQAGRQAGRLAGGWQVSRVSYVEHHLDRVQTITNPRIGDDLPARPIHLRCIALQIAICVATRPTQN
jgi:hypothetical protein